MEANIGFLSFCLLVTILRFFIKRYWYHSDINDGKVFKQQFPLPPTPKTLKPWPIVGSLPEMIQNKPTFRWIHKLMDEMNADIGCIRLGNVHVIPVFCPKLGREILKKQDATFASRPVSFATRAATDGYLTAALGPYGEQWKKMRRVITNELLSPVRFKWLVEKRVAEADHLVRYLYNKCNKSDGGIVNVRVAVQNYSTNVIRQLIFSRRFFGEPTEDGGPGPAEAEHVNALFKILTYLYSFSVSDYMPILRGLDLDGHEKGIKEVMAITKRLHDPLVDERVQQWKSGKKQEPEDLLDIMITLKDANGQPLLTVDEIKAQITEVMFATVDNPANASEWALAEMINHPELLEKARQEIDAVVGKERLVQESDLSQLNYIKACAREAFRLHPMAPFNVPHVSLADTTVGNYFIPKGSHILLGRIGLGRNPKIWEEPLRFMPERHLKEGGGVTLTEAELRFISFSTGMRGCAGSTLGTAMTVMLFARLIHGFTWDLPPGESRIDMAEAEGDLLMGKPLVALAKPRLPAHVYEAHKLNY